MLKIGKMTDYAMLILSQMAKEPDAVMSATLLADTLRLSAPTVSKILKILGDAELVTSVRGAVGGYKLGKPAVQISVADVIAAMEGDLAMTECCETVNACSLGAGCAMRDNWFKINGLIKSLLSKLSILDMVGPLSLEGLLNGK
ncbi:MAG TPA: SUF system Fe-S cluster assembly regulator [Gammaproteobacteria bacterium]|jgi:FeS assembly SUF system regulator|nr:SUF system Fe-S cluster assembly regulator [Gammaproteobacteria bacterium]